MAFISGVRPRVQLDVLKVRAALPDRDMLQDFSFRDILAETYQALILHAEYPLYHSSASRKHFITYYGSGYSRA